MAEIRSIQTEKVPLPSRALPYKKELQVPSKVLVRPFLTEDQKGLFGTGGSFGLDLLIDNCLNGPDYKFHAKDLIAADKAMILVRLRAITLGKDFEIEYICPHCGSTVKYVWDLDKIQVNYLSTDEYPIRLELPKSAYTVEWVFLTDADLEEVEEILTKKAEMFEVFDKRLERRGFRTARHITSVDGNPVDLQDAWEFWSKLPAEDSAYLDFVNRELDIGPEVRATIKCSSPSCGREFPVIMRTGLDFFRPKFKLPKGLGVKKSGLDVDSDPTDSSSVLREYSDE